MVPLLNLSNIIGVHDNVRQLQTIISPKEIMTYATNRPTHQRFQCP